MKYICLFLIIIVSSPVTFSQIDDDKVCECGKISKVVMSKLSKVVSDAEKEKIHKEYKEVMDDCGKLYKNISAEEKNRIRAIARKCIEEHVIPEDELFYGVSSKDSIDICICIEWDLNKNRAIKLAGNDSIKITSILKEHQPKLKKCTELYNSMPQHVKNKSTEMWEHCERNIVRRSGYALTEDNICFCIKELQKQKEELENCNCEQNSDAYKKINSKYAETRDKCERMAYKAKPKEQKMLQEIVPKCMETK